MIDGKKYGITSTLVVLALVTSFLVSCGGGGGGTTITPPPPPPAPLPAGARQIGLSINDSARMDFNAEVNEARSANIQFTELTIAWDDVETAPGVFAPNPDFAAIANGFYPGTGLKLSLSFLTIDTVADRRPSFYQALPWDDPSVIDAAWNALSFTLDAMPSIQFVDISIGNEVNVYLKANPAQEDGYVAFVETLQSRLTTRMPNTPVGVKITADDIRNGDLRFAQRISANMDIAMITYYPLDAQAAAQPASIVFSDFNAIVAAHPGKPIHMAEIGYPASTQCNSSEAQQAEFLINAFVAWDQHPNEITTMTWVWQNDISPADVTALVNYYGISQICFAEYLATLGLHDYNAIAKPAWGALVSATATRGF